MALICSSICSPHILQNQRHNFILLGSRFLKHGCWLVVSKCPSWYKSTYSDSRSALLQFTTMFLLVGAYSTAPFVIQTQREEPAAYIQFEYRNKWIWIILCEWMYGWLSWINSRWEDGRSCSEADRKQGSTFLPAEDEDPDCSVCTAFIQHVTWTCSVHLTLWCYLPLAK